MGPPVPGRPLNGARFDASQLVDAIAEGRLFLRCRRALRRVSCFHHVVESNGDTGERWPIRKPNDFRRYRRGELICLHDVREALFGEWFEEVPVQALLGEPERTLSPLTIEGRVYALSKLSLFQVLHC
jgi:hypothetical protein